MSGFFGRKSQEGGKEALKGALPGYLIGGVGEEEKVK